LDERRKVENRNKDIKIRCGGEIGSYLSCGGRSEGEHMGRSRNDVNGEADQKGPHS